jgi:tRNA1Val (adenine37-N6)-methyltransferase
VLDRGVRLNPDETLDDLILGGLKLIQARQGYRFSLDAVLLAHFPELNRVERVFDLGTGSGVIPLLLTVRSPHLHITGVELQPDLVDRARRSVQLNGLEDRIEIVAADIRSIDKNMPGGSAELVLSNPPFWKQGQGQVSRRVEQAIARHELCLQLEQLVEMGAYLLAAGGSMAIIQPVQRLEETLQILRRHNMHLQRLRLVHAFLDRPAGLVLVEAVKNRRRKLIILPPLIIYDRPGEYTPEIQTLYRNTCPAI